MCLAEQTQWFTIDRVGRRKLFISQALGMCGVLVAESICVAINNTPAAIGAVVFIFLFEACFTWGLSFLLIPPCGSPFPPLASNGFTKAGWLLSGPTHLRSFLLRFARKAQLSQLPPTS